jgi:threonine dehydrogenase-like Zn-dependent dehydrogenase
MVGLGAIAAASAEGAAVMAIDLDDAKLALSKRAGSSSTINSRTEPLHQRLLELTEGLGPDVVIEAVGMPETYTLAVEEAAHTGRVVYIGWSKQPVTFETKNFVHKELDILGSRNSLDEFPQVIDMLSRHAFPVEETISATVPMEEAGAALREWSASPERFTKILVEVNP